MTNYNQKIKQALENCKYNKRRNQYFKRARYESDKRDQWSEYTYSVKYYVDIFLKWHLFDFFVDPYLIKRLNDAFRRDRRQAYVKITAHKNQCGYTDKDLESCLVLRPQKFLKQLKELVSKVKPFLKREDDPGDIAVTHMRKISAKDWACFIREYEYSVYKAEKTQDDVRFFFRRWKHQMNLNPLVLTVKKFLEIFKGVIAGLLALVVVLDLNSPLLVKPFYQIPPAKEYLGKNTEGNLAFSLEYDGSTGVTIEKDGENVWKRNDLSKLEVSDPQINGLEFESFVPFTT